jgi:hypothetical protein
MPEAEQSGQAAGDTESVDVESDSVTPSTATSSSNEQFDVVDARRRPLTAHEKKKNEEKKELEKRLKSQYPSVFM